MPPRHGSTWRRSRRSRPRRPAAHHLRASGHHAVRQPHPHPLTQLCGLIRLAYNVDEFQIKGIPDNRGVGPRNFFEVDALLENGAAPGIDALRPLLHTLLAERFQLQVRREPVEMPVYVLVQEAGRKATAPCPIEARHRLRGWPHFELHAAVAHASFHAIPEQRHGRMVLDKTGLEPFTFELRWLPDSAEPQPDSPPALFTAIREQLGLRARSPRAPVDSIIVTRVERPTPN
jgi:uncharacterized protein (TIGR03435 family)